MKKIGLFLSLMVFFLSCKDIEPRKPVSVKSGSFFEESVERNKALLAREETQIKKILETDSVDYKTSSHGFWYHYNKIDSSNIILPQEDDLVTLTYDIRSLNNKTIYSTEEIGTIKYKVDKQELFPGLRAGVKLMRKGETLTFYFPSGLAYGYHGDNDRIGTNVPLVSTVTLLEIEKQTDSIN